MASKIDVALDDVIKSKKKQGGGGGGRGGKGGRGGRGGRGGGGRGGGSGGPRPRKQGGGGGGVQRQAGGGFVDDRRKGGGIDRSRRNKSRSLRSDPYAKGNADDQWSHDLYGDASAEGTSGELRAKRTTRSEQGGGEAKKRGTRLLVSDLNYEVTSDEIKELFAPIGELIKAEVVYDSSGRSEGKAYVIYANDEDAEKAIKEYNGAALDTQTIKVERAPPPARKPKGERSGGGGGGRRRGGGGGGGGRGGRSGGSFVVTRGGGGQRDIVRRDH